MSRLLHGRPASPHYAAKARADAAELALARALRVIEVARTTTEPSQAESLWEAIDAFDNGGASFSQCRCEAIQTADTKRHLDGCPLHETAPSPPLRTGLPVRRCDSRCSALWLDEDTTYRCTNDDTCKGPHRWGDR